MAIHSDALENYLEELATPANAILREMTQVGRERGFPIVGPQVGRFLQQLAAGLRARRIFELGSGFGYSTLWFALGMAPDGVIHHTDGDEANSTQARDYLTRAGVVDRVRFHVGDAVDVFESLEDTEPFDIVFCDIDKHGYPRAYEAMRSRVRVGGFVVIDNLIWSERILDADRTDADTEGIRAYTRAMWNDPDFLSSMLPIRDGVGLHLRLR
jgi:predicted O-methyltransferase YrrM